MTYMAKIYKEDKCRAKLIGETFLGKYIGNTALRAHFVLKNDFVFYANDPRKKPQCKKTYFVLEPT